MLCNRIIFLPKLNLKTIMLTSIRSCLLALLWAKNYPWAKTTHELKPSIGNKTLVVEELAVIKKTTYYLGPDGHEPHVRQELRMGREPPVGHK